MKYEYEGRIAEERRIRRCEEDEHIRLCNAGVNQTIHVWGSAEEKEEWQAAYRAWREKKVRESEEFWKKYHNT